MTLPNALMQIREALDEFDLETARKLLRVELKENPIADTYFLAAQAAIDDQQRQSFLEKAIENDPFHQEARVELHRLQTGTLNPLTSSLQPIQTNFSSLTQRQSLPIAEELVYQTSQKGKLLHGDQPISQQLHLHRTEQQVNVNVTPTKVVVINKRSRFVALLLTLLLGPLGMFYSTAPGALIMLVIFILAAAGNASSGAFMLLWFICIIWSIVAASKTPDVVTK